MNSTIVILLLVMVTQAITAAIIGYLDTRATGFATGWEIARFAIHPGIIVWHLLCPVIGWLCYRELVLRTGVWNAVLILTVVISIGEIIGIGLAAHQAPTRNQVIALVLILGITVWSVLSD